MRYVNIPNTDLTPSVICMGGGPLSIEDNQDFVYELLDTYVALGGNFIDSANIYGKWLLSGLNVCDRNIGAWMQSRGNRDQLIITSKGGHPNLDTMSVGRLSKNDVAADLDESLNALQSDTIDLYYLHRDDEDVSVEIIIDYLNDFTREGKIRYFAVSNWRVERIRAAQMYAKKTGQQGFSGNQVMWSLPVYDMTTSTIPGLAWLDQNGRKFHEDSGLAVMTYQSQARGFYAKYAIRDEVPISPALWAQFGSQENINRYDRACQLSNDLGVSTNAIALAYILNQRFPTYAIIGSHTMAQLQDSMAAADVLLTQSHVRFLECGHD